MVQTAIGGVAGLFGGGAATGLGKIASPLAARVATPVAQRVVTPALDRVVSTTIDSFAGGFRAAANEYIRPGGNVNDIPSQFVTGMLSGAGGPVAPTPARRAVPAG